jgi:hypothetical protein
MTNVLAKDNLGGGGIDKLVVREAQADTQGCPPRTVGFAPPEAPGGLPQGVTTRSPSGCVTWDREWITTTGRQPVRISAWMARSALAGEATRRLTGGDESQALNA